MRQLSGNVSVYARAGADVDAGVDAGVDVGAGADVGAGVGVDACGCEDAGGHVRDYDHADVSSHLSLEVVEEAAVVHPEEDG